MGRTKKADAPVPRSLQEWMEREGATAERLLERVRLEQGIVISRAGFSYILRGSRRCSMWNALALSAVTGVPVETLMAWPKVSGLSKQSVRRPKRVA